MFQLRLKALREEHKMSQAMLAKKLNVSQSTVGMWESGRNKPENSKLEALATLFGVSTDYLLGRDFPEPKEKPVTVSDELDETLVNLLVGLSPADVQRVQDFVSGLKAGKEASASPPDSGHQ